MARKKQKYRIVGPVFIHSILREPVDKHSVVPLAEDIVEAAPGLEGANLKVLKPEDLVLPTGDEGGDGGEGGEGDGGEGDGAPPRDPE